jgi:hypothetical protein
MAVRNFFFKYFSPDDHEKEFFIFLAFLYDFISLRTGMAD